MCGFLGIPVGRSQCLGTLLKQKVKNSIEDCLLWINLGCLLYSTGDLLSWCLIPRLAWATP